MKNCPYCKNPIEKNSIVCTHCYCDLRNLPHQEILNENVETILKACTKGDIEMVVQLLLEDSRLKESRDEKGFATIHNAIISGNYTLVDALIQFGSNVNSRIRDGRTPLHFAASCHDPHICKLLIESGADIDALDSAGDRPIDTASMFGYSSIIYLLERRGHESLISAAFPYTPPSDKDKSSLLSDFAWEISDLLLPAIPIIIVLFLMGLFVAVCG